MSNVLVIFQADTERTEQMALAVGVGAVEAEANIRLRRLAAPGTAELAHKGYGKLQEADLLWANTVVVGLESPRPKAAELNGLLSLLSAVDPGRLAEGRRGPSGRMACRRTRRRLRSLSNHHCRLQDSWYCPQMCCTLQRETT